MRADFTSALYLGLSHPSAALPSWDALTLGKPAALQPPPGERTVAAALARLMDCEAACIFPSTLHLFWDLFGVLATAAPAPHARMVLLVDAAAYPVARWCAGLARALGMPASQFRHAAPAQTEMLARRWRRAGRRPLILADGYSPGDSGPPPLGALADIAARYGGYLLLDDTQALGVLGPDGGGSVALHGLRGAPVLVGASLAKGLGAPLAVLAGSAALVGVFERQSLTRVHCSPPSAAALAAAGRALALNRSMGGTLRAALRQRIRWLRGCLAAHGLSSRGGDFPVRRIALPPGCPGTHIHAALAGAGVDVLLQRERGASMLTMMLRADHGQAEIARAAALIAQLVEVQHV